MKLQLSSHIARPVRIALILAGLALLIAACSPGYGSNNNIFGEVESTLRGFLALFGLALMLAGFAIHEFLIKLIGFIAGGLVGAVIGALTADSGNAFPVILGFIIGGFLGVALAALLTCAVIFISGFFAGLVFFSVLSVGLTGDTPSGGILVVGGVIGGLVMFALYRFWITAMTAALGSALFGLSVNASPGLWILFFVLGIAVQYGAATLVGKQERVMPGYNPAKPAPAPIPAYSTARMPIPTPPPSPNPLASKKASKFCMYCGAQIPASAAVCPNCGRSL